MLISGVALEQVRFPPGIQGSLSCQVSPSLPLFSLLLQNVLFNQLWALIRSLDQLLTFCSCRSPPLLCSCSLQETHPGACSLSSMVCICSEKRTGTLVCPYLVQSVTCANGQTQSEAVLGKRASLFLCPASVSVLHPIWTAVRGRCSSTRAGSIAVRGAAFCKGILVLIVYSPAVLCSWPHHATDHVNNGNVMTRQLVQITREILRSFPALAARQVQHLRLKEARR